MTKLETKQCQNCKNQFTVEPDDFAFYEKMKVPAPTWCPECRMIRRMLWRNLSVWYRRKCDATGKSILSMFAPDSPYKVYEQEYWRSDAWDPLEYGRDYDFLKPFFEQFKELFIAVPHPNLIQKNNFNSEYANFGLNLKNCYFVGGSDAAEDCAYIFAHNIRSRECFDLHSATDTERIYDSVGIEKSQGLRFCQDCIACSDSYLLYDCRNCTSCFGCVGLRNKQFYIFNQPYSRENYQQELEKLKPWTYSGLIRAHEQFNKLKLILPRKFASIVKSENVTGDEIVNARNCIYCFDTKNDVQNCKYSYILLRANDGQDALVAWDSAELFYEVMSVSAQRVIGSGLIWGGFDVVYSFNCFDCNNIFGCVGLHNKSYCILNKQLSEPEYKAILPRIIEQMNTTLYRDAPFAYNETVAQDYFPKTKEEVLSMGVRWRDPESKKYEITMKNDEIPDDINSASDSILNEVIECGHKGNCNDHCATAFRIVPQELQFLRKMKAPLPRLCPLCRQGERIRLKNPLHLWDRKCQCSGVSSDNGTYKNTSKHSHGNDHCLNEFKTPYSPDRKEIIYCEHCYQQETA
ncbi:MAG: hypothetical protein NTY04_03945 [Candidatus Staskawiczbacteria bacterium]|nr:hypothetical protein [Candidatus Staskawiczbacteria bacterium]